MGTWAARKGAGGRQHEAGGAGRWGRRWPDMWGWRWEREGQGGHKEVIGWASGDGGQPQGVRLLAERLGKVVSHEEWPCGWVRCRSCGWGLRRPHDWAAFAALVRAAVGRERWQRSAAWGGDATAGVGGDKPWWSSRERGCVGGGSGRPRGGAVGRGGAGRGVADRLPCHAAIKWMLVHLASSRHHDRCH